MSGLAAALQEVFGSRARADVPLAPYTTFRLGGTADWLVEVHGADELQALVAVAARTGVPLTVLGGGSNMLVSDDGVRGIVARVHGGDVRRIDPTTVRADAGVTINGLVRWMIGRGIAGLEAWAGTPGTLGGAIYGNAHFQGRMIGQVLTAVTVVTPAGDIVRVPHEEMEFGYDVSRLQRTREIAMSADVRVSEGDPSALRGIARESLAFRKRTQPLALASAGCIFQNPDPAREMLPTGIPPSAGALVDAAGLKGQRVGGAMISPTHANFIVNDGTATARDVRVLIEQARRAVAARFGVDLRDEIVYVGTMAKPDVHSAN